MTESLHLAACPACSSELALTHDKIEDRISIRLENIAPLAKECVSVVARYKSLKGLGAEWTSRHGTRGLVSAGEILKAVGYHGGQMERALGLIEWLSAEKKDYDLGSAATYVKAYEAAMAAKMSAERSRCLTCGESFAGNGGDCGRH